MKAVVVHASARRRGFSSAGADAIARELLDLGWEISHRRLPDMDMLACRGCFACRDEERCVLDDDMSALYSELMEADLCVFATPVYCFSASAAFQMMFERLYPMLGGGMASEEGGRYEKRHDGKPCALVLAAGAPALMARGARRRIEKNLRMNGFENLGTFMRCGTYARKNSEIDDRERRLVRRLADKATRRAAVASGK